MKKILIWGYGYQGVDCLKKLVNSEIYEWIGFADNSVVIQGNWVNGNKILSLEEVCKLKENVNFSVIIASAHWADIGIELEKNQIVIEGIWINGHIEHYFSPITFDKLDFSKTIKLYAGDIYDDIHMLDENLYGLSITKCDRKHIRHDITCKYPLKDNCIDSYEAEDVLEHIDINRIPFVLSEIYRILKKDGIFRLSLPDYGSPDLLKQSMMDENGYILFDADGGGNFENIGCVVNGGHQWFPTYKNVKEILDKSSFSRIEFLCFYNENHKFIMKDIDFSLGYVHRVKNPLFGKITNMVVDLYK